MMMVYIPEGEFLMGSEDGESDESPPHAVFIDAFWMDEHEITVAQYAKFLNEMGNKNESGASWMNENAVNINIQYINGNWQPVPGYEAYPVVEVTWYGARAYCDWSKKRLPTEAEWEKAARGGLEDNQYPWGNVEPECEPGENNGAQFAECGGGTVNVMSFSQNEFGLYDMAGNVWEWVSDQYSHDYYEKATAINPQGPLNGAGPILRGGSWKTEAYQLRSAFRIWNDADRTFSDVGFRCAAAAP
jgi:formylglycine-generating enzyme required for sulfatase activity